ncbi:metal ABC transporter solute-binding protein, Zn/Mn family [Corynebacterium choanae]|uniref:metal ABC transporter solute-binding protein, Zn/Mn family n=1 Tax=Corynebacterium choanae TaxID=1862358 RepID=UPI001FECCED5|nr:zinc ABC transporter substrate-binding protein [Corynebacterium choanae]
MYASFFPIYSLTQRIAGDEVEVRSFMPEGQDPHLWEPTPKHMADLARADLLVVNGANMEPWLPLVQAALPDLPILNLSDYVELITYKGAAARGEFQFLGETTISSNKSYSIVFGHTHESSMRVAFFPKPEAATTAQLVQRGREIMLSDGQDTRQHTTIEVSPGQVYNLTMGHESGEVAFRFPTAGQWLIVSDRASEEILPYIFTDDQGNTVATPPVIEGGSAKTDHSTFDPHSWLSIVNGKRYANAINVELKDRFPEYADTFQRNKVELVSELTTLQAQFVERLQDAPRKEFLTAHNAFAYLARDFGLKQYPLQGLTTNAAPKLGVLIESIRLAHRSGIPVVFYEDGEDPKMAEVIADEIGGTARPLISMEHGDAHTGQDYVGITRRNLEILYEALR